MLIDYYEKTINIKIVYFGPALSGKTTSIKSLFSHFGKEEKLNSIENTVNRTLFFDYGTVSFQNQNWILKIHIYTTTGQDFYIVTRPITLRAVDGVIFVIDSQKEVFERNLISWNELVFYFKDLLTVLPVVIAFNKHDLPEIFDSTKFLKYIKFHEYQNISSQFTIAINGEGILDCFEDLLRLVLNKNYDSKMTLIKD